MSVIMEAYGRKPVNTYASKHGETVVSCPSMVIGLELEIENFDPDVERRFGGVQFTEDGSLRSTENGIGIEAITLPIEARFAEKLLAAFYRKFDITEGMYTERCSTHIHVNADPFTWEQLATLCLVYQTVESLLFMYVGEERSNNIFCVPWNQCGLGYNIVSKLSSYPESRDNPLRGWQKYSALNLLPLSEQGSIEFRHLGGTCNISLIMGWINIIGQMYKYAQETPFDMAKDNILKMNTVSNYHEWMGEVFGRYVDLLRIPDFERVLAAGVVDSKLALISTKTKKITTEDRVRALYNEAREREMRENRVTIHPFDTTNPVWFNEAIAPERTV